MSRGSVLDALERAAKTAEQRAEAWKSVAGAWTGERPKADAALLRELREALAAFPPDAERTIERYVDVVERQGARDTADALLRLAALLSGRGAE